MLCAIDPGLRHCGVALFGNDSLLRSATVVNSPAVGRGPAAWNQMALAVAHWVAGFLAVIEVPRIYPRGDQRKGDLNDLLEVAGVVGAIAGRAHNVIGVYPADWKGQVPKNVMNKRVLGLLSAAERSRITSFDHNALDAVGIGLHHLGRLNRKRVFR